MGFDQVSFNFFFYKSKRRRFEKNKIKSQRVASRFLPGQLAWSPGSAEILATFFFINLTRFQPQVLGRPVGLSFKTMVFRSF